MNQLVMARVEEIEKKVNHIDALEKTIGQLLDQDNTYIYGKFASAVTYIEMLTAHAHYANGKLEALEQRIRQVGFMIDGMKAGREEEEEEEEASVSAIRLDLGP